MKLTRPAMLAIWLVGGVPGALAEGGPATDLATSAQADPSAAAAPDDSPPPEEAGANLGRPERCGCAAARLLKPRKGELALGADTALAAWIDVGRTRLQTFDADFFEGGGTSSEADAAIPVREETFVLDGGELAESRHELVRVFPTGAWDKPFYVGLVRPKDAVPKNVAKTSIASFADGAPAPGPGPALEQLWLGPKEERTRGDCGAYETRRAMWREAEGSSPLAGFLVRDVDNPAEPTYLVDVRHVRMFGFGKVRPCDHGFPLESLSDNGAASAVEIRPVSESFGVGPGFILELPDAGLPLTRSRPPLSGPSEENPFAEGLPGLEPATLGHEEDKVALASILGVLGGAAAFAAALWPILRRRKKYIETVACTACGAELELDLADPKSDGTFCPACGKTSVFVTFEADGTPRAVVVDHRGKGAESPSRTSV